jgi:hypothetical protein
MRRTTRRKSTAKRKTTTRRRRRVSGIGKVNFSSVLMDVAGLAGGAIIARELSTVVLKQFPQASHMMIGAGQIAAGVILPMFLKSKLGTDLGNGMIAFGGQVLAVESGLISGIGMAPGVPANAVMSYSLNGMNNIRAISGANNIRAVSGTNKTGAYSKGANLNDTY